MKVRLSDKRPGAISWWEVGALCAMHIAASGLLVGGCTQLGRDSASLGGVLYSVLLGAGGILLGSFHFRGRSSDFEDAVRDGWRRARLMGAVLCLAYLVSAPVLLFAFVGLSQVLLGVSVHAASLFALPLSAWLLLHAIKAMRLSAARRPVRAGDRASGGNYLNELLWRGLAITHGVVPGKQLLYGREAAELGDSEEEASLIQGLTHMTSARRSTTHREMEEHLAHAMARLEEARGSRRVDPLVLKLIGSCRLLLGESKEALRSFQEARAFGYEEPGQLSLEEALALLRLERWEQARSVLDRALREEPALLPVVHRAKSKLRRALEPVPRDGRDFNFFDLLARLDLDECMSAGQGSVIERVRIDLLMREIRSVLDLAGINEEKGIEALVRDANENKPVLDPTAKVVAGCLATLYRTKHGVGEER